jgi:hypothetical protein
MTKINENDLFFTCSLLEFIGRQMKQRRSAVANMLGKDIIMHIYHHADVLHCEVIEKTADYFENYCKIPIGNFDCVADCKYTVPSYWDIGQVYMRLIRSAYKEGDLGDTIMAVYNSFICDAISNFNSDLFYQPPDYLFACYEEGKIICEDLA